MKGLRAIVLSAMLAVQMPGGAAAQSRGSAAAGAATFRINCSVCHAIAPERTIIGPSLYGVVGRHAGSLSNFRYSPAMMDSTVTWTEENIIEFLAAPTMKIPGTRMTFSGLADLEQRLDVVAYLKSLRPNSE